MATKMVEQASVRVLRPSESQQLIVNGVFSSRNAHVLPRNCMIVPMRVLDKPEPVQKKKRSR